MPFLKIKNWDRWQSYRKDRGQPPWIKVHRRILRNPEWVALSDAQRGQLVAMWLLAADKDGVIPASPELIQKLCFMDSPLDIQVFISLGFIEDDGTMEPTGSQVGDNVTPPCLPDVTPKAEAKAEAEAEAECPEISDEIREPPKQFPYEALRLTKILAQLMLNNDEKARIPKTQKQKETWIGDMDKINRLDGRSWTEIESVVRWCQSDDFWRANILSPSKLRKQFPKLLLGMGREQKPSTASNSLAAEQYLREQE